MKYQIWARPTDTKHCASWWAQSVADSFELAADRVRVLARTHPTYEWCVLPFAGSFPVTVADYQRIREACLP